MTGATQLRRSGMRSLVIVLTVALVVVALVSQTVAIHKVMAREDVPLVTDLDRDLLAADAVDRGMQPFTTLGELKPDLPAEWAQTWVAHSPLAIVMARGLSEFGDRSWVVAVYRWVSLVALVSLILLLIRWRSRDRLLILAAITVAVWAPTVSDLRWVQTHALVALGLAAVLALYSESRRWWALALLGFLVAWKPWLAFLALFLPGSSAPWRDVFRVGLVSAGLTIAVLPWAGGWDALRAWLLEAMPSNTELSREIHTGILSFTAEMPLVFATVTYVALVIVTVILGRRMFGPQVLPALGGLTHLAFGPLVWDHYWLALLPAVCWPIIHGSADPIVRRVVGAWLVLSALSHPINSAIESPAWVDYLAYGFVMGVPVALVVLWWSALRGSGLKGLHPMTGVTPAADAAL